MNVAKAMSAYDPEKVAYLEAESWVAYYRRRWPRLLRLSVGLVAESFQLPLPQALYGAYLAARAQMIFAPKDNDVPRAEAAMRRFYELVNQVHRSQFDPAAVARLELNWWVVHRQLFGQSDNEPLVQALTDLYAAVYEVEPGLVREATQLRAEAMQLSDRWVNEGCAEGSPLIAEETAALAKSYNALQAVTANGRE